MLVLRKILRAYEINDPRVIKAANVFSGEFRPTIVNLLVTITRTYLKVKWK